MLLIKTQVGPSKIHGLGLFAEAFILKGTRTWIFLEGFDLRLPVAILDKLSDPAKDQLLKYSSLDTRLGVYELCSDDARFFNHSDTPNTRSIQLETGEETDVATRDIEAGEELTCDYRTFDGDWKMKLGR